MQHILTKRMKPISLLLAGMFVIFTFPGMNAILLYMGHEMIKRPLQTFWQVHPKSHAVYLPINIADTAVFVLLAYFLYRHSIFISVWSGESYMFWCKQQSFATVGYNTWTIMWNQGCFLCCFWLCRFCKFILDLIHTHLNSYPCFILQ